MYILLLTVYYTINCIRILNYDTFNRVHISNHKLTGYVTNILLKFRRNTETAQILLPVISYYCILYHCMYIT